MKMVDNRFDVAPSLDNITRSTFHRDYKHLTSANVGDLVPLYCEEVLPGDSFRVESGDNIRLPAFNKPIFDDLYFDMYYFFCPLRILWDSAKEFFGENNDGDWSNLPNFTIPQISSPSGGFKKNDLASYFIRQGVAGLKISKLYINAYCAIYNDFFRDQNFQKSIPFDKSDNDIVGLSGETEPSILLSTPKGGKLCKAFKYHDYFTSCLPNTQKGPSATLPLGSSAPVILNSSTISTPSGNFEPYAQNGYQALFYNGSGNSPTIGALVDGVPSSLTPGVGRNVGQLFTDLSNATAATINQFRQALQLQKFFELDARSGTRYIELIKAHFGVTSSDYRVQRPEFLGGSRTRLNITQVVQNDIGDGSGYLGNLGAFSHTVSSEHGFTEYFNEHGIVLGVGVVRYKHLYQQGINRMFSRRTKNDYYWPLFDGLGEQAVLNKEIYATGLDVDEEVFGYQERYAEYRYREDRVSGEFSSDYSESLDVWHLADDYSTTPALSSEFLQEDELVFDRVLNVSSKNSNQVHFDMYFKNTITRQMPLFSIPQ